MNDETSESTAPSELDCPVWCTARHDLQRHEMDRWHESDAVIVPVIELASRVDLEPWRLEIVGLDIEVGLEQRVESVEVYVYFGVGDERARNFRLSIESMSRLLHALTAISAKAHDVA